MDDDQDWKRRIDAIIYGNGKPGLLTRMTLQEDVLSRIDRNVTKMTWIIFAAFLAFLGDVLSRVFGH